MRSKIPLITNIPLRAQETGSWCWAATQQMVMWYHGPGHYNPQCGIANAVLKDSGQITDPSEDCCRPDRINLPICTQTAWPNFSLFNFHVDPVDVADVNDPLGSGGVNGWNVLRDQICRKVPFLITLQSPTNSHQYIVNGYKENFFIVDKRKQSLRTVYAIDPMGTGIFDQNGNELLDLKVLSYLGYKYDEDGRAVHTRDFINISPQLRYSTCPRSLFRLYLSCV